MTSTDRQLHSLPHKSVKETLQDKTSPLVFTDIDWLRAEHETIRTLQIPSSGPAHPVGSNRHSPYSVWTVNPRYTSQTCHVCGERGVRVEDESSTTERKGGEYFYCARCDEHFHADINAARNIIHVQER